jgi:hypothetical protein
MFDPDRSAGGGRVFAADATSYEKSRLLFRHRVLHESSLFVSDTTSITDTHRAVDDIEFKCVLFVVGKEETGQDSSFCVRFSVIVPFYDRSL